MGECLATKQPKEFVNAKHTSEGRTTDILDITPIIVYQICSGYDYAETTGFVEYLKGK